MTTTQITPDTAGPDATADLAPVRMKGILVLPRVTATTSHGAMSILEQVVEPGAGSPLHRCTRETKVITVLEGEFEVARGEDRLPVAAGNSVVVEPGAAHCFRNRGAATGRVLVTLVPGGHEAFLRGLAAMGGPANADPVELAAHCRQYGVELCR